jgi:protein TonB
MHMHSVDFVVDAHAEEPIAPWAETRAIRAGTPDLRLETGVVTAPVLPRRSVTFPVSVGLHVLALAALAAAPLLVLSEPLPEPHAAVRAFLAPPLVPVAPPPPPPALPKAPPTVARVTPARESTARLTVPVDVPVEIRPDELSDLGEPGGVEGGVEGGVPGGVVGGIVGGLDEAPPPPAAAPVRVGGDIREPRKLRHVAPIYPQGARDAHVGGVVILECVLSPRGEVADVKVLRGVPLLSEAAVEAVRLWTYTPTLVGGVPVSVVMTVTVQFNLGAPR